MSIRLVLAWLHLVALAIGVGGVWSRARALRDSLRDPTKAMATKAITSEQIPRTIVRVSPKRVVIGPVRNACEPACHAPNDAILSVLEQR